MSHVVRFADEWWLKRSPMGAWTSSCGLPGAERFKSKAAAKRAWREYAATLDHRPGHVIEEVAE